MVQEHRVEELFERKSRVQVIFEIILIALDFISIPIAFFTNLLGIIIVICLIIATIIVLVGRRSSLRKQNSQILLGSLSKLSGLDLKTARTLYDLGVKQLWDISKEDPEELSTILDRPIEMVRKWVEIARKETSMD